ncbi:beta-hexosaminidase [Candidatus Vecturithrix granuli]|uniref:beta-N-acetylhexosaminidase n=1 Tax=Vecturithrix granuli TaxID=1499967 RepID=A0A081C7I6_VECG1|nr:beta-hexosaminidase [Candidatus Vecturithrix granuli]
MNSINIIPQPLHIELKSGVFCLTPETEIIVSENTHSLGESLAQRLRPATGFQMSIKQLEQESQTNKCIVLQMDSQKQALGEEGYELSVTADQILVTARAAAGVFYGCQTLLQLFPADIERQEVVQQANWTIPQLEIEDIPRFSWRGMHLDVCRHFMPTEFVKKYLDLLARYKMNVFHWHLTDDQGWRIEIKGYPELTEIAAWRSKNGARDGGFYTRADIEEVVAYARERFVTIVPEIEMPGHAVAALAAYPELSCNGGQFEVETLWGIFDDVFCAGNDKTFEFLQDVLAQVIEMFPGQYLHVGGDECPKNRWKACPKCQARIRAEGLKDEEELQSWFIKRIETFLSSRNRRLIGWDEILEGGLPPRALVMSWRGMEGGIEAARLGYEVVMCPQSHCYFDHYQSENYAQEPEAIKAVAVPLEKVYEFEPMPAGLTVEECRRVLGAQGNLWTEYIKTPEHAEYMLLPRLCAIAEVVWSEKRQRDLEHFLTRLNAHYPRFDALKVKYRHDQ